MSLSVVNFLYMMLSGGIHRIGSIVRPPTWGWGHPTRHSVYLTGQNIGGNWTTRHVPGSNLCYRCLETCRSLRFSPPDLPPPDSCVSPGRGGRNAATPGRPCQRRSGRRSVASGAESARPTRACWTLPEYERQVHELCGGKHIRRGLNFLRFSVCQGFKG